MILKINLANLVKISVRGSITNPVYPESTVYNVSPSGKPFCLPGVGGITYNVRIGDLACRWVGDHVEPGVSIENIENDSRFGRGANVALNILSCVGNEAVVVSGDAKGTKGIVTGKHGGIDHVLIDFQQQSLEKMVPGDNVLVKAHGLGLELNDYPDIRLMNIDPLFLERINPKPFEDSIEVPVTHIIPASLMGSGIGQNHVLSGDCDIQMFDEKTVKKYNLKNLRLGDLIAIVDADHSFGRVFRTGAITIGIVVHTSCLSAGHGPGVTTLMTSKNGKIIPTIVADSNIKQIMEIQ